MAITGATPKPPRKIIPGLPRTKASGKFPKSKLLPIRPMSRKIAKFRIRRGLPVFTSKKFTLPPQRIKPVPLGKPVLLRELNFRRGSRIKPVPLGKPVLVDTRALESRTTGIFFNRTTRRGIPNMQKQKTSDVLTFKGAQNATSSNRLKNFQIAGQEKGKVNFMVVLAVAAVVIFLRSQQS